AIAVSADIDAPLERPVAESPSVLRAVDQQVARRRRARARMLPELGVADDGGRARGGETETVGHRAGRRLGPDDPSTERPERQDDIGENGGQERAGIGLDIVRERAEPHYCVGFRARSAPVTVRSSRSITGAQALPPVRSGPVAWVIMQAKASRRSPAAAGSIQPMNHAELNDFDVSISAVPVLP